MGDTTQQLIDQLWDFYDAAASEARFRLASVGADAATSVELRTQIARALGLQRRFDEAFHDLDAIERDLSSHASDASFAAARVRLALERGRVLNSSKCAAEAMSQFEIALHLAQRGGLDTLAVDAAHMIAIVHHNTGRADDALEWNRRALTMAESSSNPRARQWGPSLHNNLGWTLHDQGDYADALEHFENALTGRVELGKPADIRIARWCVGRCLRSLGRLEEALALQQMLLAESTAAGETADGYTHEEIAECLHALGRIDEARPHFAAAHAALSKDARLIEREPQRIGRLARLSRK